MKITKTQDINSNLESTFAQLQAVKIEIFQEHAVINPKTVEVAIDKLHREGNNLARQVNQSVSIMVVDTNLKRRLLGLIDELERSSILTQVIGNFQAELVNTLNSIKNSVKRSEKKTEVSKVDQDEARSSR